MKGHFPTELQKELAQNIKAARRRLGWSQMKLAEQCGISTSFLGCIETGSKFPSPATLEALAEALGLEPYRLFKEETGTEEREKLIRQFSGALRQRLEREIKALEKDFLPPKEASEAAEQSPDYPKGRKG